MTIARHTSRMQVCCDTCPASYPNTYEAADFTAMIADAKSAGWVIRKARAAGEGNDTSDLFGAEPRVAGKPSREDLFTHTCPACARPLPMSKELF